jgi:plastocyanin
VRPFHVGVVFSIGALAGCGDDATFVDAAATNDAPSLDAPPSDAPVADAPAVVDADLPDAPKSTVVRVDCPAKGQPDALVTVERPKLEYVYSVVALVKRPLRPGDVVRFDMGTSHDARSGVPGFGDRRFHAPPGTSCWEFTAVGEYPFYCTFHEGLTGSLTIEAPPT